MPSLKFIENFYLARAVYQKVERREGRVGTTKDGNFAFTVILFYVVYKLLEATELQCLIGCYDCSSVFDSILVSKIVWYQLVGTRSHYNIFRPEYDPLRLLILRFSLEITNMLHLCLPNILLVNSS